MLFFSHAHSCLGHVEIFVFTFWIVAPNIYTNHFPTLLTLPEKPSLALLLFISWHLHLPGISYTYMVVYCLFPT